jgi:hypothetical protein
MEKGEYHLYVALWRSSSFESGWIEFLQIQLFASLWRSSSFEFGWIKFLQIPYLKYLMTCNFLYLSCFHLFYLVLWLCHPIYNIVNRLIYRMVTKSQDISIAINSIILSPNTSSLSAFVPIHFCNA